MSLKNNFCASPWFHMRINNTGGFEFCRWAIKDNQDTGYDIVHHSPVVFFQQQMSSIRKSMLDGNMAAACSDCHVMDQHHKVSGRQKQLLKVGVSLEHFEKTMLGSPWIHEFEKTYQAEGATDQHPQDWQIDLGNYCNSACVFCSPYSSSRLATEFKKIGLIQTLPKKSWCDDPRSLEKFLDVLKQSKRLRYLHFIGGETLITPAFSKILQVLIEQSLHQEISIGFTTNLTVWNQEVVDKLTQFKEVNLGMSIECLHPLNDYVRYGSTLKKTKEIFTRWNSLAKQFGWLVQLRTTPTVLSIWHLDTIYYHAVENQIAVESCNFLDRPEFLRASVLPESMRIQVIDRLKRFQHHNHNVGVHRVINIRDPNQYREQIDQDIQSYINYLESCADESFRLPDLIRYLKTLERNRGNCILDYLPEYAQLFRSAGY